MRGLTLIEVLVAMLILGTAVASLIALIAQQSANIDAMRTNVLARIAANNVMVEAVLNETVDIRDDSGTVTVGVREFYWQVIRTPSGREGVNILRVEIREPDTSGRLLASLQTLSMEEGI